MKPGWLEQTLGACLVLLVLADMFLTVLYARVNMGRMSAGITRTVWRLFLWGVKPFPRQQPLILSFCGPVAVLALVAGWALVLTLGTALVIHPALGTAVASGGGRTPTDFLTALYAGGSSIAVVGVSDFTPKTPAFRMLYLFNSLVGMSLISLALTYLMQVYSALQRRNSLAAGVHAASGSTGDAAELIAGLGAEGHFSAGYTSLTSIADESGAVTESHHFYPVLFYFRFREPHYSVSRLTLVSLDAVSLIKSGLHDDEAGWFKESAAVAQLWVTASLLVTMLTRHFITGEVSDSGDPPDPATAARWRRRYAAGLRRLRQAGIRTVSDERAGAEIYVSLRARWDRHIRTLAPALDYRLEEIDPASADPESADRRPEFCARLPSVG